MLGERDVEALLEARDAFLAQNEIEAAAEAENLVSQIFSVRGDRDRSDAHGTRAVALVEGRPLSGSPGPGVRAAGSHGLSGG